MGEVRHGGRVSKVRINPSQTQKTFCPQHFRLFYTADMQSIPFKQFFCLCPAFLRTSFGRHHNTTNVHLPFPNHPATRDPFLLAQLSNFIASGPRPSQVPSTP